MKAARRGALPLGWLGVVAGCLLLWHLAMHTGLSGDVYWQWAAGRWMLNHGHLLTHDVFSYTVLGKAWIAEEWGYEVLLAESIRLWGPGALWFWSAGVGTMAVLIAARHFRFLGAGWTTTGLLALFLGYGLQLFLRDRPQEVSYLLWAGELLLLSWARRKPNYIFWTLPLLGFWANVHGSFLLGLSVLLLEAIWAWWPVSWGRLRVLKPLPRQKAVLALGTALMVTTLNPHGFALIEYALHLAFNPRITNLIVEWQSPNFHQPMLLILVAVPLVSTVLALTWNSEPVAWAPLILAGGLLLATLVSVRYLPYFLIAWTVHAAQWQLPPRWERAYPTPFTWGALAVISAGMLWGPWAQPGVPANTMPRAAVAFLRSRHGRVFTRYRWGGYMIWSGFSVFVDGRTDLYAGSGILTQYMAIKNLTQVPDTVFRDYQVDYVMWPRDTALSTYLAHDPAWSLIFVSRTADIYQHRGRWASVAEGVSQPHENQGTKWLGRERPS